MRSGGRFIECVLTYLALALAALPAYAESSRALTLDEALKLARQNNRDLVIARGRLDESHAGIVQARSALLPSAALVGIYTHNYKDAELELPPAFGFTGPVVVLKQNALQGGASLTVPLVVPSGYPSLAAAESSYDAAKANYEVTATSVLFGAAQAFFTAAGADEVLQARQDAVQVARVTLQNAQARLEAGTVNKTEVMRAQLALVNAQQAEVQAEDNRDRAYRSLATILVLREPFHVVPPQEPASEPSEETPALTRQALQLRPEIPATEGALRAARDQAAAAAWRWSPTIAAFANANISNYAGFTGNDYAWAYGAQLSWTLYDGGLRDAARDQAAAQAVESDAQLAQLHDTISDDVANAQRAILTQRLALKAAQQSVALSRETLDLLRVQYDAGTATQLDVLQAQDALESAEVTQAQARFDLSLAYLTLRRVTGTFPDEKHP